MILQNQTSNNQLILVVDDSPTELKRAALLLDKHDQWDVLTAKNGSEAISVLESHEPNLVVTDLQMPDFSGLELLQEIHKMMPDLPVVMMTAEGNDKIAMQCLREGAASYVPKSDLAFDLSQTVERLLERAQKSSERHRLQKRLRSLEHNIENDLKLISSLTHELHVLIQQLTGLAEGASLRITTAIDEALLNAYYHGNLEVSSKLREENGDKFHHLADERNQLSPYKNRRIRVKLEFSLRQVMFSIRDQGPGFDSSSLPDPTDDAFLDRPHGRGILLMRSFMDEVRYNGLGNEVRMTKYLTTTANSQENLSPQRQLSNS